MTCHRENQVHAYHDRQLGPAAREAFEEHLAGCPDCSELLTDLRDVSLKIAAAPLPEVPASVNARYYEAWNVSRQRGLLRVASWLTASAAVLLVGALVGWQNGPTQTAIRPATAAPAKWEAVALMPPPARLTDRPDELIELAQWMADDLSTEVPGMN